MKINAHILAVDVQYGPLYLEGLSRLYCSFSTNMAYMTTNVVHYIRFRVRPHSTSSLLLTFLRLTEEV